MAVAVAVHDGRGREEPLSSLRSPRALRVLSLYQEPDAPVEPPERPALQFRDVFKIFRASTDEASSRRHSQEPVETVALRGLDLDVALGEVVAIMGPSGCGKSTLLHLAAGLDRPTAGDVRAFGRSLVRLDEGGLAAYRASEVAIIFQTDNLWPTLTAEENVAAQLSLAGVGRPWTTARQALSTFGLDERRTHRAQALSGGEVQRVAIAAAAASRAPLVLADEPTGELDQVNERLVLDALTRLRDEIGSTVVIATHSTAVAERADRIVEMRDGAVLWR